MGGGGCIPLHSPPAQRVHWQIAQDRQSQRVSGEGPVDPQRLELPEKGEEESCLESQSVPPGPLLAPTACSPTSRSGCQRAPGGPAYSFLGLGVLQPCLSPGASRRLHKTLPSASTGFTGCSRSTWGTAQQLPAHPLDSAPSPVSSRQCAQNRSPRQQQPQPEQLVGRR